MLKLSGGDEPLTVTCTTDDANAEAIGVSDDLKENDVLDWAATMWDATGMDGDGLIICTFVAPTEDAFAALMEALGDHEDE